MLLHSCLFINFGYIRNDYDIFDVAEENKQVCTNYDNIVKYDLNRVSETDSLQSFMYKY